MPVRLWAVVLACVLAAVPARAQETRGNINGVVQDATGVIPGATVRITNTDNSQTQQLITNGSGYFEAVLLPAGNYAIRVEMPSFKTLNQTGVSLGVGQTLSVTLKLEVGQVSERVDVVAQAPLLDTSTVSSGQNFDRQLVDGLPMFSNMPIMLSRFTPGVVPNDAEVQNIFQGYMEGTTLVAGGQVGTGSGFDSRNTGNNYTIDGAVNNGFGRRIASSPNSAQIQEMRVETSNFDASQGAGTGLTVSMMTRAGTNALRGSVNYTHWNNQLNSPNLQQKITFAADTARGDTRTEEAWRSGRSHIEEFTLGGPLYLPKVFDGRNKAFFFANFSKSDDSAPGRLAGTSTVPASRAQLDGDFSQMLLLPSGAGASTFPGHHQYQIYDPLTTRPDPTRPGRMVRTPFPGNIIPMNRIKNADGSYKNPSFGMYQRFVPAPNQNLFSPTTTPTSNYYRAAEPDQPHNTQVSLRVDYNPTESDRFFIRGNGNKFLESSLSDWTYASPDPQFVGLHDVSRSRYTIAVTGNWTKVLGATVVDTQVAGNRANQRDTRKNMINYKPTDVGLPSYMDDYCLAHYECILPQSSISSYPTMGGTVDGGIWITNYQGQSNLTSVRGAHTVRGGIDVRYARRESQDGAGNMGSFTYNNTYTRGDDQGTSSVYQSSNLGLSMAAFMLGLPTSVSIADSTGFNVSNNYFGTFAQDTWRLTRNLTINLGLRFEYENGIREKKNRALLWFDPTAPVSIAAGAKAAYAANPIPELPVSQFDIRGGTVYMGTPGYMDRTWNGEPLWMPRFSFGYKLGDKTVIKGGWGVYYDTINARDWTPNQTGFDATTSNNVSNDLGQTFALGDPRNGILPLADPFPTSIRGGSRYEVPVGNVLGLDALLGGGFTAENMDRTHSRVQRWRLGWQRELNRRTALEVAYSGSYADRQGMSIRQDYLPEQWWSGANVRDTTANDLLTANVTNPFNIVNFASFQTSNPALYTRLQGSSTFTGTTIVRNRLLRPFPHMNGLNYQDQPVGVIKSHSLEIIVTRRYANGLSGHGALTLTRVTSNRTVEEYDRAPTLWETNNNGRPYRAVGAVVYELPFGAGKAFLTSGGALAAIASGWTVGGTTEYQPGALLNWGNIFFTGNLDDIKKDTPEIALLPFGTFDPTVPNAQFDPTKTWFNIDAGFEKATANQPAGFQKRVFPFRIDGVRGQSQAMVHANVARTFDLGARRTLQFRVDIQNLLNRQQFGGPQLNPTSTTFGQVRAVNNTVMRFITFGLKFNF